MKHVLVGLAREIDWDWPAACHAKRSAAPRNGNQHQWQFQELHDPAKRLVYGRTEFSGGTPRQREVLQLLAEGCSMKEAARILGVTPRTIAFHKYRIMEQFRLKSNAELIQFAIRQGVVSIQQDP